MQRAEEGRSPGTAAAGGDRAIRIALVFALCGSAALWLVISQAHALNKDEIEHVHSAWHVASGRVPYRDFFQHHHPLQWYLLAPATGDRVSPLRLLDLRIAQLPLALALAWATHRIAVLATASSRIGWLAVLLLVTMTTFVKSSVEIRPDVPFAVGVAIALVFYARAVRDGRQRPALAAGFFLAIGLLFHQKAVLVVAVLAGLLLLRGRGGWRLAVSVVAPPVAALLLLVAWYAWEGALRDYWAMAWTYNWLTVGRSPHRGVGRLAASLGQNLLFWVATIAGVVRTLREARQDRRDVARTLAAGVALLLVALVVSGRPVDQYLLPVLPLFAVMAATALSAWVDRQAGGRGRLLMGAAAVVLVPSAVLLTWTRPEHSSQFERLALVHDLVPPGVPVYDGDNRFSLFRPDVHHRWFSVGREPETSVYNRLAAPAHVPYDGCQAIRTARPRVISNFRIDLSACHLASTYGPAAEGLYVRIGGEN